MNSTQKALLPAVFSKPSDTEAKSKDIHKEMADSSDSAIEKFSNLLSGLASSAETDSEYTLSMKEKIPWKGVSALPMLEGGMVTQNPNQLTASSSSGLYQDTLLQPSGEPSLGVGFSGVFPQSVNGSAPVDSASELGKWINDQNTHVALPSEAKQSEEKNLRASGFKLQSLATEKSGQQNNDGQGDAGSVESRLLSLPNNKEEPDKTGQSNYAQGTKKETVQKPQPSTEGSIIPYSNLLSGIPVPELVPTIVSESGPTRRVSENDVGENGNILRKGLDTGILGLHDDSVSLKLTQLDLPARDIDKGVNSLSRDRARITNAESIANEQGSMGFVSLTDTAANGVAATIKVTSKESYFPPYLPPTPTQQVADKIIEGVNGLINNVTPLTPASGPELGAQATISESRLVMSQSDANGGISPFQNGIADLVPGRLQSDKLKVITFNLVPDGMGTVNVKMRLSGSNLDVELKISSSLVKEMLEIDKNTLSDKLNASGYMVEKLQIGLQNVIADGIVSGEKNDFNHFGKANSGAHDPTSDSGSNSSREDGSSRNGGQQGRGPQHRQDDLQDSSLAARRNDGFYL